MALVLGKSALVSNVTLLISRGSDTVITFRYLAGDQKLPVDLTGYTAKAQIRKSIGSDVWITLTNTSGITLTADGYITITLGYLLTNSTDWDYRYTGVWDVEIISPNGTRTRFIEGPVKISQDVTRG